MTQKELVKELAERLNISMWEAGRFLSELKCVIYDETSKGNKVKLTGLGVFNRGSRAERRGIDPQTGDIITIPKMVMPRFRPGSGYKKAVRN